MYEHLIKKQRKIPIIALDGFGVFVKFAVIVGTNWMKAQVIV